MWSADAERAEGRRPQDPHRPDRGQRRRVQPERPVRRLQAVGLRPRVRHATASRSSSRPSPCSSRASSSPAELFELAAALRGGRCRSGVRLGWRSHPSRGRAPPRTRGRRSRLVLPTSANPSQVARFSCMAPLKDPVRVAVTGAAGQIGYSLLFRIAIGSMLGPDQPVILQLLEITPALERARGRGHGARGLRLPAARRHGADRRCRTSPSATPTSPCSSGRMPRKEGMERPTCSRPTAASSSRRARRCRAARSEDVKVLVVGNPANTNALIAQQQRARPRPAPLHRDDPPRPQPGHGPARRQGRRARSTTSRR